ncbi:hypothetical protein MTP99_011649 [Tenebrio molitor]|jgi:hypothetical protein|nr:hypothetical protein MTP99_011649 [Tenebrio molitor]
MCERLQERPRAPKLVLKLAFHHTSLRGRQFRWRQSFPQRCGPMAARPWLYIALPASWKAVGMVRARQYYPSRRRWDIVLSRYKSSAPNFSVSTSSEFRDHLDIFDVVRRGGVFFSLVFLFWVPPGVASSTMFDRIGRWLLD